MFLYKSDFSNLQSHDSLPRSDSFRSNSPNVSVQPVRKLVKYVHGLVVPWIYSFLFLRTISFQMTWYSHSCACHGLFGLWPGEIRIRCINTYVASSCMSLRIQGGNKVGYTSFNSSWIVANLTTPHHSLNQKSICWFLSSTRNWQCLWFYYLFRFKNTFTSKILIFLYLFLYILI